MAAAAFPIVDQPSASMLRELAVRNTQRLTDSHGRAITDLRVSVTNRCNYRCVYCRNGEDGVDPAELPIADYARMIRLFVGLGVEKVRLTGGEPLLRRELLDLIAEVADMRPAYASHPDARMDIALTTNGHLLETFAQPLRAAGLSRITVSMDAVEPDTFARITRVPGSFERVLRGVRAAQAVGFDSVKVNAVLLRGFNDDQIEAFARFSRDEGVIVRFIEWMPLEEASSAPSAQNWAPEAVITLDEIVARLQAFRPLVELPPNHLSETARRFTFDDGLGEIGIIAPVSRPFCGHCSRIRLTSDGSVRTCLFSQTDHSLMHQMRMGADDAELAGWIRGVVMKKEARHHIGEPGFLKPSRSMVHIGG